jgi:3,4-dihydroxy 2-butanone 4-phosphate synthase/GTP cyclohydrolase II
MDRIEREGAGVVVYFPPGASDLVEEFRLLTGELAQRPQLTEGASPAQREHGLGAQILMDLGLNKIRLMTTNPRRLVGLSAYGLDVIEMVRLGPS